MIVGGVGVGDGGWSKICRWLSVKCRFKINEIELRGFATAQTKQGQDQVEQQKEKEEIWQGS